MVLRSAGSSLVRANRPAVGTRAYAGNAMKRGVRPNQILAVVMLALAGVGVGHVAEYLLLAPHAHDRQALLARTGHHYLASALHVVAFVALVGVSLVFLRGLRRGLGRTENQQRPVRWSLALPAVQMLAFFALELGERLIAHSSLADIVVVLAAGLPLQALVGYLANRAVAALEQVGERLGLRIRGGTPRVRRAPPATRPPLTSLHPALCLSGAPIPARGPPPILVRA